MRLTCGLRALTAPRAYTRHCHSVSNGNERPGTLATRRLWGMSRPHDIIVLGMNRDREGK